MSDWFRFVVFEHMSAIETLLQTESQAENVKVMLFGL